jgi:type I restriction enzyme S subunit
VEVAEPSAKYLAGRGYRRTELGLIPSDWEIRPLSVLFDFRNGVNADKDCYGQGVRFINVLEPITHSHLYGPEIPGQVTLPAHVAASYAVRKGDVLFNRTSETQEEVGLAATYIGTERVVFGGFVIRGRPTDQSLDPAYSGYALRAPFIRSQIVPMGQGAIRANIGQHNLGRVVAPVPPLAEQREIASALGDADALIESLEQLLSKKRLLKHGVIQELLRPKGGWKSTNLGSIADPNQRWSFTGGPFGSNLKSSDYTDEGVRIIQLQNIGDGEFKDGYEIFTSILKADELLSCNIYPGEIILSKMGDPVARACIVPSLRERYLMCSDGIRLAVDKSRFDTYFVYTVINALDFRTKAASSGTGSTRKRIGLTELRSLELLCPLLPEQTTIAAILSDIDTGISALEAKLTKARQIKQGMMQELLTGRIRLV